MAGHFRGSLPPVSTAFPAQPQFSGFMKPCRFEGEISDLEIEGTLPPELDGTFYRVMPDPHFPPYVENDPWFNGDGSVSAFRFHKGRVSYKQKYVRTEKFVRENEAQRALAGKYRNKYTDAVDFKVRTTANTNIFYFNKVLLAIKEDALPYAMDPVTLETIGLHDFDGQMPSLTYTAHPKVDPETKEMLGFGYEARGDGTPDICYTNVSADGKVTQIVWLVSPVVAMIHDFAVTKNWVLFPIIPQVCDIDELKKGGEHWRWDPKVPFYLGVLPRHGATGADVKWFRAPNAFPGHTTNAYENEKGEIVFDLPLTDKNVFFWWPDAQGNAPNPQDIHARYVRFTFDPKSEQLDLPAPEVIQDCDMEFPRIDDRVMSHRHRHSFFDVMVSQAGTDFAAIMPVLGGGHPLYNSIGHLDHQSGLYETYTPGRVHMVQEPIFVPRSDAAPEGDGFVIVLVNNYATQSSELHVIDTKDFSKPQAVIKLGIRLRAGLHGNWVDARELTA